MMQLWSKIFLKNTLFYFLGLGIFITALGYLYPFFIGVGIFLFAASIVALIAEIYLLYSKQEKLRIKRKSSNILSLGWEEIFELHIENRTNQLLQFTVIDELPKQFNDRHFKKSTSILPEGNITISYEYLIPERGDYNFGNIIVLHRSMLGLITYKEVYPLGKILPGYPSIKEMELMEIKAFSSQKNFTGLKKTRRIGHSYEFEQIKSYVKGDDFRALNWKATARSNQIMVNQYQENQSQYVYSIIDKSRGMKQPFNGLSLLDYSINATLALSNLSIKKKDKAGLLTVSDKIGKFIPAESASYQTKRILKSLYNEQERQTELNLNLLYKGINTFISSRSLIFLYTNFQNLFSVERALPILRSINKKHELVVVFFENDEVEKFASSEVTSVKQIFLTTVAKDQLLERQQMMSTLQQFGIQVISTSPNNLSINTINKYLEMKARGII